MTFSDILEFWCAGPTAAEVPAFRDALTSNNIFKERVLAVFIIAVSIFLMAVDYLVGAGGPESARIQSSAAIAARLSLIVFLAVFLVATRSALKKLSPSWRVWDAAFVGVSLAWFSAYSGALLTVRPGIAPYLMTVLTLSAFLCQGAFRSALVFGGGFLLFAMSARNAAADERLFLSAMVNGGIGTLLAFVISRVTFASFLQAFRNEAYIAGERNELMETNQRLQRLSFLDPLTNIANRRFLEMSLSREWKLQARSGLSLSIIMIDIDWFKSFNDNYGHLAGDDCLRRVATTLEAVVRRPTDLVTRYGGEEFCVLLPMTDQEGAIHAGKRMMRAIHDLRIPHAGSPSGFVTVSMGIASCRPEHDRSMEELVHAADTALYNAKIGGRNRLTWQPFPAAQERNDFPSAHFSLAEDISLESESDLFLDAT